MSEQLAQTGLRVEAIVDVATRGDFWGMEGDLYKVSDDKSSADDVVQQEVKKGDLNGDHKGQVIFVDLSL